MSSIRRTILTAIAKEPLTVNDIQDAEIAHLII